MKRPSCYIKEMQQEAHMHNNFYRDAAAPAHVTKKHETLN